LLPFFAAFLPPFFAAFLVAIVSILPFPLSWNDCDVTSSQFDSCIESTKKIVKQKTRVQVRNSPTLRPNLRSALRKEWRSHANTQLIATNARSKSRMNAGDSTSLKKWKHA
jgi:hypothetical protein